MSNPHAALTVGCQRELFEVPPDVTYLNSANLAPQLKAVTAAGFEAVRANTKPWLRTPTDFFSGVERLRTLAARVMNASPECVAIVPAVSYGIAVAAANVPVAAGQTIVVLDRQFPSNVYAWRALATQRGARLHAVPRGADGGWTQGVLDAIDADTAVVAVPNCHWTDGSLVDLSQVGAKARSVGAALVVDASQSFTAMPIDVQAVQPDFLVSVGYKWQLGPYGLGYLYVAPRWQAGGTPIELSWMARAGSDNFASLVDYEDTFRPGARRFDVGESAQFTTVPMATAALEQILAWGVDNIQQYLSTLTQRLADGAASFGGIVLPRHVRTGHLIGIRLPGGLPEGLGQRLAEARIYVSVRGDSLRVGPHMLNDEADVDRLLSILRTLVTR